MIESFKKLGQKVAKSCRSCKRNFSASLTIMESQIRQVFKLFLNTLKNRHHTVND